MKNEVSFTTAVQYYHPSMMIQTKRLFFQKFCIVFNVQEKLHPLNIELPFILSTDKSNNDKTFTT